LGYLPVLRDLDLYGKAGLYGVIVALLLSLSLLALNLIYLYAVLDVAVAPIREFISRASLIYTMQSYMLALYPTIVYSSIYILKHRGLSSLRVVSGVEVYRRLLVAGAIFNICVLVFSGFVVVKLYTDLYDALTTRKLIYEYGWGRVVLLFHRTEWFTGAIGDELLTMNLSTLVSTALFTGLQVVELLKTRRVLRDALKTCVTTFSGLIAILIYAVIKAMGYHGVVVELAFILALSIYAYGASSQAEQLILYVVERT